MTEKIHPGLILSKILEDKNMSQREFALKIDVAQPVLNNILQGNRNININLAISLEAIGIRDASYWMSQQIEYSLYVAKKDETIIKKNEHIKVWDEIDRNNIAPLSFFKKHIDLNIQTANDVGEIYQLYDVKDFSELKTKIESFNPKYFRKSSKFIENRNNVFAWSMVAEFKAKQEKVAKFSRSYEKPLIEELKKCFYKNRDTVKKTKKILNKYGIKFFVLDRPPKTPVDGKSFISGNNPAIVLTLKYKRLDNFAFSVLHEAGHVFEHLTNPKFKKKYKNENFFKNSMDTVIEEFEADNYAKNKLISPDLWDDFILLNDTFSDDVIIEFSKKHKIHPGIVRGRVCFEFPEYYRKRTSITAKNKLDIG